MTPGAPIALTLAAMVLVGLAAARLTRDTATGACAAVLVLGVALLMLGTVATAMFVPGGILVLLAVGGIVARRLSTKRSGGEAP